MLKTLKINFILALALAFSFQSFSQDTTEKATPIFKDGEAQIVEAFNNPEKWVHHDLWVETEFDTDGDGDIDVIASSKENHKILYNIMPF